ncbi:MAG: hypothetical protein EPO07_04910 [Verrucomicrobia bacterium]|nr:MAG: hypothetical protein EPO07_04910 [Verrucomicrobiota bacterium]
MKSPSSRSVGSAAAAQQVASFLNKFDPKVARVIRACRAELRKLLPTAIELVYDNYNFFVIGYSATERVSDCILSLTAAANGVGLSFYQGASLPDPKKLLLGEGKQNRFIRLPTSEVLRSSDVLALIRAAVAQLRTPLPTTGGGYTVVKSVSAKQRPRRKSNAPPTRKAVAKKSVPRN